MPRASIPSLKRVPDCQFSPAEGSPAEARISASPRRTAGVIARVASSSNAVSRRRSGTRAGSRDPSRMLTVSPSAPRSSLSSSYSKV